MQNFNFKLKESSKVTKTTKETAISSFRTFHNEINTFTQTKIIWNEEAARGAGRKFSRGGANMNIYV